MLFRSLLEPLHQVFGTDRLVAFNVDTGNRRPFDYSNDQDIAIAAELDILKEPGFEQRTSGLRTNGLQRADCCKQVS